KRLPKKLPTAPNTLLVAGLGAAPGEASAEMEGAAAGAALDAAVAIQPLCNGHGWVGSVPLRNGKAILRGHPAVATPPLAGSIVTIVMPGGGPPKPSDGCRTASVMTSTHAGRAAWAPERPILCGSSKPTQTPATSCRV